MQLELGSLKSCITFSDVDSNIPENRLVGLMPLGPGAEDGAVHFVELFFTSADPLERFDRVKSLNLGLLFKKVFPR